MRRTTLAAIVAVVVILAAAFWWLDFRAAVGESRAQTQSASYSSGQPTPMQRGQGQGVTVYVRGDEALTGPIGQTLAMRLDAEGVFASAMYVVADTPQPTDQPVLVIDVNRRSGIWTPLYGHSELVVNLIYGSDGDVAWWGTQPIDMPNDHPTFWMEGTIEISDVQWGVTSRPAYARHLAEQIAAQVAGSLERSVTNPT